MARKRSPAAAPSLRRPALPPVLVATDRAARTESVRRGRTGAAAGRRTLPRSHRCRRPGGYPGPGLRLRRRQIRRTDGDRILAGTAGARARYRHPDPAPAERSTRSQSNASNSPAARTTSHPSGSHSGAGSRGKGCCGPISCSREHDGTRSCRLASGRADVERPARQGRFPRPWPLRRGPPRSDRRSVVSATRHRLGGSATRPSRCSRRARSSRQRR